MVLHVAVRLHYSFMVDMIDGTHLDHFVFPGKSLEVIQACIVISHSLTQTKRSIKGADERRFSACMGVSVHKL